jgi:hypothetical protein
MTWRWREGRKEKQADLPDDVEGWFPDPDRAYDSRLRKDGRWTGWVSHEFWDPRYGDQPDSLRPSSEHPTMLAWHGKRVVITGSGGDALDVALDSCVSARIDEVPGPGCSGLMLRLEVELSSDPSRTASRTRVRLLLPRECAADLKRFVNAVESARERCDDVHYSDQPAYRAPAEPPSPVARPRHAAPELKSIQDGLHSKIQERQAVRNETLINTFSSIAEQRLNTDEWTPKDLAERPAHDLEEPGTSPGEVRRSVLDTTMPPDLPRLPFTQVPDADDWLSFHPLASGEEIRARETSGHEDLVMRYQR